MTIEPKKKKKKKQKKTYNETYINPFGQVIILQIETSYSKKSENFIKLGFAKFIIKCDRESVLMKYFNFEKRVSFFNP